MAIGLPVGYAQGMEADLLHRLHECRFSRAEIEKIRRSKRKRSRRAKERMLADLAAAGRVDGVLLDLHGAMVAEDADDGEGALLERIREAAPRTPLESPCMGGTRRVSTRSENT